MAAAVSRSSHVMAVSAPLMVLTLLSACAARFIGFLPSVNFGFKFSFYYSGHENRQAAESFSQCRCHFQSTRESHAARKDNANCRAGTRGLNFGATASHGERALPR